MKAQVLGDAELHFWLTRSVAKVMGISLSEAMASGRLTAQDYAAMVTECRECPLVQSCQCWLGEQRALAKSAPPGCANANQLKALAQTH